MKGTMTRATALIIHVILQVIAFNKMNFYKIK